MSNMYYTYDVKKNVANESKHGLSLEDALAVFDDPEFVKLHAKRKGEKRFMGIGMVGGRLCSVIFTERGMETRLISARWSTARERSAYRG